MEKTQRESKKKSQKRQTTTKRRFWSTSFFSSRKQNYVKFCTALEREQRELGEWFQQAIKQAADQNWLDIKRHNRRIAISTEA